MSDQNIDIDNMDADELRDLIQQRGLAPNSAQDLYGGSPAGGGTPIRRSADSDADWLSQFESDWNSRNPRSAHDYQRYVVLRLGRHAYGALKRTGKAHIWSKHPAAEDLFERF